MCLCSAASIVPGSPAAQPRGLTQHPARAGLTGGGEDAENDGGEAANAATAAAVAAANAYAEQQQFRFAAEDRAAGRAAERSDG